MSETQDQKKTQEEYQRQVDEILKKELERNSKSNWLTRAFVEKPFVVVLICSIVFVICTVATLAGNLMEMSENHDRDYLIWSNERTKDFDNFMNIREEFLKGQINSEIPVRSQEDEDWETSVILHCEECSDILNVKSIQALYKAEQMILNHKDYKNFCLATTSSNGACADNAFRSFTQFFDNIESLTQDQIDAQIDKILNNEDLYDEWKGSFSNQWSKENKQGKTLRSIFKFGAPLDINGKRFKDIYDNEDKQGDYFEDFSKDIIDICRDKVTVPGKGELLSFSEVIDEIEMQRVVNQDFLFAIGSIIFVLIYISIHLHSFFLGSMSMLSILVSFPITLVFFRLIFQIDYFSSLHVLVVFIVLGIAADNVFVFTDAWNQSATYDQLEGDYNKRMAVTFKRASRAMLATSSTTGAAFLATGMSPIMPIASFGFFAGILIPVNFILVITFYPAILIIYEKHTKKMCVCKNKKVSRKEEDEQQQQQQQQDVEQQQDQQQKQEKKRGVVEEFFGGKFNSFTQRFRFPIIAFFLIWTGIATWRTAQFPALSEPEQFLPDDFDTQMARSLIRSGFHQAGNSNTGIKVYQYWGAKGLDRSDVGKWDSADTGKVKWDNDFDLSPEANQQYFFDLCEEMQDHNIVQDGQVMSFIFAFKDYAEQEVGKFPVPQDKFMDTLVKFTETASGQFYYNTNQIGIIKGELKFVWIQLAAHGRPFAPYKISNPIFKQWDKYNDRVHKEAPQGLKNSKQTAILHWVFMITEQAFVSSAIQGMGISLVFAFIVLMLTTHNIVISGYSILSIAGIVVSVMSIMEMAGWELGVAESVTLVILIGLSVDYVVHLANHYIECVYPDKFRKMKVSLEDLGISIISGATTTLGSGFFLFFATIIIFNKFAILIFATILFSLIWALFFFSALVHIAGPEGNCGNLLVLFKKKGEKEREQSEKDVKSINEDLKKENQNVLEKSNDIVLAAEQKNKNEHVQNEQAV